MKASTILIISNSFSKYFFTMYSLLNIFDKICNLRSAIWWSMISFFTVYDFWSSIICWTILRSILMLVSLILLNGAYFSYFVRSTCSNESDGALALATINSTNLLRMRGSTSYAIFCRSLSRISLKKKCGKLDFFKNK